MTFSDLLHSGLRIPLQFRSQVVDLVFQGTLLEFLRIELASRKAAVMHIYLMIICTAHVTFV